MATGTVTETIVEEVATNLEEAAQATRKINTGAVGFLLGGLVVGVAVGFYFGQRYNREKIRAEIYEESEEQLEEIRAMYRDVYKDFGKEKPAVEDLVEEKGYVVEERPLKPPVPIMQDPRSSSGEMKRTADGEKTKDDGWSYPYELSKRSVDRPYIIHQDEFSTNETDYAQVTYSYYAGDDVFTDEHDTPIAEQTVDDLLGRDNLKWGHGSDDFNVLYIRNSKLEIEFELCRSPRSYEEEVGGLENSDDESA